MLTLEMIVSTSLIPTRPLVKRKRDDTPPMVTHIASTSSSDTEDTTMSCNKRLRYGLAATDKPQVRSRLGDAPCTISYLGSDESDSAHALKRTSWKSTPPSRSTTKSYLKKARHAKWKHWCAAHQWKPEDDPDYQQKVGDMEVHKSCATAYYRLKDYEISTLPHVSFRNDNDPNIPEKSYNLANLRALVSRKFAFLAGINEELDPKTREVELLRKGWKLFSANMAKREAHMRDSGRARKALSIRVVYSYAPHPPHDRLDARWRTVAVKPRPYGSWTTPVYEHGVYVGQWLNFQFDPEEGGYGDFYKGFQRFRRKDVDWVWERT